jgi:hypothetical protein
MVKRLYRIKKQTYVNGMPVDVDYDVYGFYIGWVLIFKFKRKV